jgi:hypothetical protein
MDEFPTYVPCPDTCCARKVPANYCPKCLAEWERRDRIELDRARDRRRVLRAERKAAHFAICAACGEKFKGKRKDAKFCSDACRQWTYRRDHAAGAV